jgi:hypothetical protein
MNITYVDQGFAIKDTVVSILPQQEGIIIAKPIYRMHIGVFLGKQHVHSYWLLYTYHRTN